MEENLKTDFLELVSDKFDVVPATAGSYSPLTLAYLGDSVFELIIRSMLVAKANRPVGVLNRLGSTYAVAKAQAQLLKCIYEDLTKEEQAIADRGKNAKPKSVAKHATAMDYSYATSLEALIGYLYLEHKYERLMELVSLGIKRMENIQ